MTAEQTRFVTLLLFYLLVGIRFTGMMFSAPAFMASSMPLPLRFWCAFFLTLAAVGTIPDAAVPLAVFDHWTEVTPKHWTQIYARNLSFSYVSGDLYSSPECSRFLL